MNTMARRQIRKICWATAVASGTVLAGAGLFAGGGWQGSAQRVKTPSKEQVRLEALKREAAASVEAMHDLTQQMVDSVFSFGE